jgi:hypothetical protein
MFVSFAPCIAEFNAKKIQLGVWRFSPDEFSGQKKG